ncbi:MAG TPA: imidazole glycerol phosphate synthase subunit HisH [Dokdonella sp.]
MRAVIVPGSGANFGSLREACRRVGVDAAVSDDPHRIAAATHVILPGVGAAAPAMRELRARGLDRVLPKLGQPLLGICLGMQLLFEASEESDPAPCAASSADAAAPTRGLGLLRGRVRRLPPAPSWPHMGWNTLCRRAEHPLLAGIGDDDWFYFVHGYAAPVGADTLAATTHGETFSAVVACGRVHGVQFHPEKSAASGRRVLANFFALAA